ncbi:hypothetical protein AB1Y20_006677 [Prymnesium parvum]|uniref:Uncharacterized protein n=1 Tax=Prymnesium parvum TaxID=97485 RepID=A0AB34J1A9_PRYPA
MPLLHLLALADFAAMFRLVARHSRCADESCHAQPASCPQPTPGLASSRPAEGRVQNYSLSLVNAAAQRVALSWLEPNGQPRAVLELAPGERRALRSRTGDVWRAREVRGEARLLMEHQVGPVLVRDCGCADAPLVACPPRGAMKKHNRTERPEYEPAGWVNAAGVAVEVYLKTAACELLLQRVERGAQVALSSWTGQSFRVRRADDQRLLLEQTVGEVWIRPCAAPDHAASRRVEQLEGRVAELERLLAEHRRWTGAHVEKITKYLLAERRRKDEEQDQLVANLSRLEAGVGLALSSSSLEARPEGGGWGAMDLVSMDNTRAPAHQTVELDAHGGVGTDYDPPMMNVYEDDSLSSKHTMPRQTGDSAVDVGQNLSSS